MEWVGDSLTISSCCRALHGPSWNRLIVGLLNKNLMDSFIDIQLKRKNGKTTQAQNPYVMLTVPIAEFIFIRTGIL